MHTSCRRRVDLLRTHLEDSADTARLLLISRRELPFVPVSLELDQRAQGCTPPTYGSTTTRLRRSCSPTIPDVDPADLGRVVDQGAGWAAALVLAAHTLRAPAGVTNGTDTRVALTAVTDSTLDYLTDEVFADYSPALQQVLLATCQQAG